MQNFQKLWQVQVQGQIYEAELEELKQWIVEGSVLPSDNVRRGELRWLPAEKVPALYKSFNSVNAAVSHSFAGSGGEVFSVQPDDLPAASSDGAAGGFPPVDTEISGDGKIDGKPDDGFCRLHRDSPTEYACDICENFFCKKCPKSFGGSVKLCPLCGSLCREISKPVNVQNPIGAIHKPHIQIDESAEKKSQSNPPIPGVLTSLACSLKYYKKITYRLLSGKSSR